MNCTVVERAGLCIQTGLDTVFFFQRCLAASRSSLVFGASSQGHYADCKQSHCHTHQFLHVFHCSRSPFFYINFLYHRKNSKTAFQIHGKRLIQRGGAQGLPIQMSYFFRKIPHRSFQAGFLTCGSTLCCTFSSLWTMAFLQQAPRLQ